MKNHLFLTLFLTCFFLSSNIQSQTVNDCSTPEPSNLRDVMSTEKVNQILSNRSSSSTFTVRVMFHILRYTNGTAGPTSAAVQNQVNNFLNPNYAPQNICFTLVGINDINNTAYINNADWFDLTQNTLYPLYGNTNRLDIFVFPTEYGDIPGNAFSIPSDFLAMAEGRFGTSQNMSHEVGHCLGLLHTHQGWNNSCPNREHINGGNCATTGDLCCDTDADPNLDQTSFNSSTCVYSNAVADCQGTTPYTPPFDNYMSYGWTCRDMFSVCQRNRMQAELTSGAVGPLMLDTSCDPNFTLSGTINSGTYEASNYILTTGTVNSGSNVTIGANNYVRLTPGTLLSSGSEVEVNLDGCN